MIDFLDSQAAQHRYRSDLVHFDAAFVQRLLQPLLRSPAVQAQEHAFYLSSLSPPVNSGLCQLPLSANIQSQNVMCKKRQLRTHTEYAALEAQAPAGAGAP
jgi:hypothetical protein